MGLTVAALGYSLLTALFLLALRFTGEGHWLTTIGLYLPRWPFMLPLPLLVVALSLRRRRWLLVLQGLTALCWLFPIAGLRVGAARSPTPGRHVLRVLSFNAHSNPRPASLLAALRAANADIIAIQESGFEGPPYFRRELPAYEWVAHGQFVFGSRFPIADVLTPPHAGRKTFEAYIRYRLELPEGPVHVYSVHPPSPRLALSRLLAEELGEEREGATPKGRAYVRGNASERERQLRLVVQDARSSRFPVIIAGDTNLPDLSPVLADTFSGYHDIFDEVGRGFGYTFPAEKRWLGPWMRIDRVFVSDAFRPLEFSTLPTAGSDHLPVLAVVELSTPSAPAR